MRWFAFSIGIGLLNLIYIGELLVKDFSSFSFSLFPFSLFPKTLTVTFTFISVLLLGCGGAATDEDSDNDSVDNDSTPTEATASTPWRFAVVGDTHIPEANLLNEMVPSMISEDVKLVLVPGDIVDSGTGASASEFADQLSEWKALMAPLYSAGIGVYPIRGNHENDAQLSIDTWNTAFSEQYRLPDNGPAGEANLTYSFTYKNALFVGLDEYVNIHQVNQSWLNQQFSENATHPHVFVFGHEPAFKAFHTDCLDDYVTERDAFWSSLAGTGAKIYLSGHDHFFDMSRMDDGDGDTENDLYQVIIGSGGGDLFDRYRYVGDNSTYTPTGLAHLMVNGYLLVELSGEDDSDLEVTLTFKQRNVTTEGLVTYDPAYSFSYMAKSKLN